MECAEKVVVACYLLDEGVDERDIVGFLAAMEAGCLDADKDSLALRRDFLTRPFASVPSGALGDVVRLMMAKIEMDEIRREFSLGVADLREIGRLIKHVTQSDAAAAAAKRRVMTVIKLLQG